MAEGKREVHGVETRRARLAAPRESSSDAGLLAKAVRSIALSRARALHSERCDKPVAGRFAHPGAARVIAKAVRLNRRGGERT